MAKQTPEGNVLNAVCEYLEYKRHTFWRTNTHGVYDTVKKTFRTMPKYALKGVSDLILLKDGKAIFIEVKAPKGVLSEHQKDFGAIVTNAGAEYIVVRSIDDIISKGL